MEVPRRQTGADRLLRLVVRPLQGTCTCSRGVGGRIRRQHIYLQDRHRAGAGTRRSVRHPLDPDAALRPHGGKAPDRAGRNAKGCAQGGHRQSDAQQIGGTDGTGNRRKALSAEPPLPDDRSLPRGGDLAAGFRTTGNRYRKMYRMRHVRSALRQAGGIQARREWKNCVRYATCSAP